MINISGLLRREEMLLHVQELNEGIHVLPLEDISVEAGEQGIPERVEDALTLWVALLIVGVGSYLIQQVGANDAEDQLWRVLTGRAPGGGDNKTFDGVLEEVSLVTGADHDAVTKKHGKVFFVRDIRVELAF